MHDHRAGIAAHCDFHNGRVRLYLLSQNSKFQNDQNERSKRLTGIVTDTVPRKKVYAVSSRVPEPVRKCMCFCMSVQEIRKLKHTFLACVPTSHMCRQIPAGDLKILPLGQNPQD